jgi:hypothetical protein
MSKRYYITDKNNITEIDELEYLNLFGDETIKNYVADLYHENISLSDIPSQFQEQVQAVVNNRIARFGEYNKQELSPEAFYSMIEEVL